MARLATVYDFSSLQLHPDGSRVQQNVTQNLKPRYAAASVQDARGNWFARDAAGVGTVGKYRSVREEVDLGSSDDEHQPSEQKAKGKAKETTGRRRNPRPAKRQKFVEDHDFLASGSSNGTSSSGKMLPSSDLLKSIHYFASSYYHERGQLFNATKEYRQMRRQNKLVKLGRQRKADVSGDDFAEWEDESEEIEPTSRGGRKKGVIGRTIHRKDMYKMLDGSALMEYVIRTLEVRIPDGWEEMMREAYGGSGGDETGGAENDNDEEDDDEGTDDTSEEDEEEDLETKAKEEDGEGGEKTKSETGQHDEDRNGENRVEGGQNSEEGSETGDEESGD
ncbi:hypothetical protein H0H87_007760 [Tephrocybe sp. NHM501043]|nr:hypothetical protein H0H87_007760 [Tephrocybe sp. NHM501043]